jgi:hypothetical protein
MMTYAAMLANHRYRMRELRNTLLALFATVSLGLASVGYATATAIRDAKAMNPQPVASRIIK